MYPPLEKSHKVKTVAIRNIKHPGIWIDVRGKVVQFWESNSDAISQVGLLADETGRIKFVSWRKSNLPLMEENRVYLIKNAVVDSWNDRLQVNLNRTSRIIPLGEDIEVDNLGSELEGVVRDIIPESGFIMRCPECRRVLVDDVCMVHGEVEPVPDLRIKAGFDTDESSEILVLNRDLTEKLLEVTLTEAEGLDKSEIDERMRNRLIGSRFVVEGSKPSKYFLVSKIKPLEK